MAHSVTARKRIRQNARRRARNRWRLRAMRAAVKNLRGQILHGSEADMREAYRLAASAIDKTAQKGVIHKNTAARYKSRLNKRVKTRIQAG
ncbi:MAG: 30S ribosomal protein S20 [Planctomycetota bacterium]